MKSYLNFFFIGLIYSNVVFSQSPNFINTIDNIPEEKKTQNLKVFSNYKDIKNIRIVKLDKLENHIKNNSFKILIPGLDYKIQCNIKSLVSESESNYSCYGAIGNEEGEFFILSKDGKINSFFRINDRAFSIYYNDDDTSTLIEFDTKSGETSKLGCGNFEEKPNIEKNLRIKENQTILPCYQVNGVRVLCLVTPAAKLIDPNYIQTINNGIGHFNTSAVNSNITNTSAKLINTGIVELNFSENTNISNDSEIDNIKNNNTVISLRNQYAADIVILIAEANYVDNNNNPVAGFVRSDAINTSISNAFAVVRISAINSQYTLAHEVGHLLGGRHQNDTAPSYTHGYAYDYKNCWLCGRKFERTIMAIQSGVTQYTRVLRFSNPNVTVGGTATGTTNTNNVARIISEVAPLVAAFKPERLNVSISGNNVVQPLVQNTWEANVSCGGSSYSYEWSESSNGINYYTLYGINGNTLNQVAYPGASFAQYKRVKVTSSDGQIATGILYVTLANSILKDEKQFEVSTLTENSKQDFNFEIYPNPSEEKVIIKFNIEKSETLNLSIFDEYGTKIKTYYEKNIPGGSFEESISLKDLNKGIYYLNLTGEKRKTIKRILVK